MLFAFPKIKVLNAYFKGIDQSLAEREYIKHKKWRIKDRLYGGEGRLCLNGEHTGEFLGIRNILHGKGGLSAYS